MQAAREAARRIQCTNNLKQLGLALHNYESVAGASARRRSWCARNGAAFWSNGWSVHGRLLPFMEQGTAFNAINFTLAYSTPDNTTVSRLTIAGFLCPSEVRPEPKTIGDRRQYGVANYNWNVGDWYVFGGLGDGREPRGVRRRTGAGGWRSSPTA